MSRRHPADADALEESGETARNFVQLTERCLSHRGDTIYLVHHELRVHVNPKRRYRYPVSGGRPPTTASINRSRETTSFVHEQHRQQRPRLAREHDLALAFEASRGPRTRSSTAAPQDTDDGCGAKSASRRAFPAITRLPLASYQPIALRSAFSSSAGLPARRQISAKSRYASPL